MLTKKLIRIASLTGILAVILAAGSVAFAQSKKDVKRAKDLTDQANRLFNEKNYKDAADAYGQAVTIVPNNPYGHFWKGYAHYYLKEYDPAATELGLALSQGFKPIEVYKLRWYIYYEQKDLDNALADIQKGLAIEPNNLAFLKALGEIQYSKGAFAEALASFKKALLISQTDGDLYYNIARVELSLNDPHAQADAASKAVSNGTPMMGESYYLLGDAEQKLKHTDGAIQAYRRAISVKPMTYQAYRNLADLYRSENRLPEAIDISKKALLLYPNDGYIYTDLSWYYSLSDMYEQAVGAAQAGIRFLPDQYMAYTNLCRASNDTKQYFQAISACLNALKLNPSDGETYFYLARAYDLSGKKDEATQNYAKAVAGLIEYTKHNPDYSDGYYLLGNAYFADNQRERAIDAYKRCLEISPRFIKARYNLGIIYALKKNKQLALEQYAALAPLDAARAAQLKSEIDKLK